MTNDTITMTQSSHPITWPWKALENTHLKMVIPDHLDDKLSNHLVDSNSLYITWFHVYIYQAPPSLECADLARTIYPTSTSPSHLHSWFRRLLLSSSFITSPRISSVVYPSPFVFIPPQRPLWIRWNSYYGRVTNVDMPITAGSRHSTLFLSQRESPIPNAPASRKE